MTMPSGKKDFGLAGLLPSRRYRVRRAAAVLIGISPPIVCAFLASGSDRWDLFERSGAITTAVGLLVASRRLVEHGAVELAMLQSREDARSDATDLLEDVVTGKLGLALSAFGTIVWGWGKYLGWWSFALLAVWALFLVRDAYCDAAAHRPGKANQP